MKTLLLIAALAAVSGCATMIDQHVEAPKDWPLLDVRDNVVGAWEIQRKCYKYVPLGWKLMGGFAGGCAEINFEERTCNIYRAYDASPEWMEHEKDHCLGRDHVGDSTLADAWEAYKLSIPGRAVAKAAR